MDTSSSLDVHRAVGQLKAEKTAPWTGAVVFRYNSHQYRGPGDARSPAPGPRSLTPGSSHVRPLHHCHRPGSPRATAHREQDVLRVQHEVRRRANTQTCPVCIGMPGSLPVMNRRAVELALRTAVALNCQIARFTKWDRKNYYYPDLPKGYQISQFDLPLSHDGWLPISDPKGRIEPKRVGIIRAHLEEDAGKSMHDELEGKADSRIDLNRCGVPLLEIVSQPDMRSPAEARAYLTELKLLLNYLEVSDCNMQEGSLRVDANVNLHIDTPAGKVATPIVEVKNMNSFRAVERALAYEAPRQYQAWQETGQVLGQVPKTTRGWDEASQTTRPQRSKEESSDYRYFPDPDLVPVTTTEAQVERIRAALGELPAAVRERLEQTSADHSLRRRRAGQPGARAGRLLRRVGPALRRRQDGQQLGAAGRAADAQGTARRHRPISPAAAGRGRSDRDGPLRAAGDRPRPRSARRHDRLRPQPARSPCRRWASRPSRSRRCWTSAANCWPTTRRSSPKSRKASSRASAN